jgi:hypothetical protein
MRFAPPRNLSLSQGKLSLSSLSFLFRQLPPWRPASDQAEEEKEKD